MRNYGKTKKQCVASWTVGLVERDLRAKDLGFLLEFLVPVVNRLHGHI